LVSRRVRRPPPHPPLSLHDALPICAYVWRLANAAQERAEELGMQLHHYYGASLQPEIGTDLHRFLDRHPQATGLLLNNEAAAAALPTVLREREVSAPAELSVLGRFSDEFARTCSPPFSAVDSAAMTLGRQAVEALVNRMQGSTKAEPHVVSLLPPTLDDRGSVTAPRAPSR